MDGERSEIVSVEFGDAKRGITETKNKILLENIVVKEAEYPSFASMVLKEESADDIESEDEVYTKLQRLGYFSPARGMANIGQVFDDTLYANVFVDEKGIRYIKFCQKYADGSFSPVIKLPQAGLGIAAQYHFNSKSVTEPAIRSKVASFIVEAYSEYYGKIMSGEELNLKDVLNVLYYTMSKLPVKMDVPKELSAEQFYRQILRHIVDIQAWVIFPHKSYYMLDGEGIEKLAHGMDMSRHELLRQLKKHDFLYLTESSDGYQTNARFTDKDGSSFTQWIYCIYKLKFFAGIEEKKEKVDF